MVKITALVLRVGFINSLAPKSFKDHSHINI